MPLGVWQGAQLLAYWTVLPVGQEGQPYEIVRFIKSGKVYRKAEIRFATGQISTTEVHHRTPYNVWSGPTTDPDETDKLDEINDRLEKLTGESEA